MQLAGVDHITVAPALLADLASPRTEDQLALTESLFDKAEDDALGEDREDIMHDDKLKGDVENKGKAYLHDEERWHKAMAEDEEAQKKLKQALEIFGDMQRQLETMMKPLCT